MQKATGWIRTTWNRLRYKTRINVLISVVTIFLVVRLGLWLSSTSAAGAFASGQTDAAAAAAAVTSEATAAAGSVASLPWDSIPLQGDDIPVEVVVGIATHINSKGVHRIVDHVVQRVWHRAHDMACMSSRKYEFDVNMTMEAYKARTRRKEDGMYIPHQWVVEDHPLPRPPIKSWFVVGRLENDTQKAQFEREKNTFGDMVSVDAEERNLGNGGKSLEWLCYAIDAFPNAKAVMKTDMDTVIDYHALWHDLSRFESLEDLYYGRMNDYAYCGRFPRCNVDWYFMSGQGYLLGRNVIKPLCEKYLDLVRTNPDSVEHEDLQLGKWLHQAKIPADVQQADLEYVLRHEAKTEDGLEQTFNAWIKDKPYCAAVPDAPKSS